MPPKAKKPKVTNPGTANAAKAPASAAAAATAAATPRVLPPPKKITLAHPPKFPAFHTDTTIHFKIDNYAKIKGKQDVFSEEKVIEGFPWQVKLSRDGRLHLLCLHSRNTRVWWVKAKRRVRVMMQKGEEEINAYNEEQIFTGANRERQCANVGEKLGANHAKYLQKGSLVLEIHILPNKEAKVEKKMSLDFSTVSPFLETEMTVKGGKKVFVNKQLLATHSSVFKDHFTSAKKNDLKLDDVEYEAFVAFLKMIHRVDSIVTETNAESVLKLAQKFKAQCMLDHAEKFYFHAKNVKVTEKLRIADTYKLDTLMRGALLDIEQEPRHQEEVRGTEGAKVVKTLSAATKKRVNAVCPKKQPKAQAPKRAAAYNWMDEDSDDMIDEDDLGAYVRMAFAARGFDFF